jgi:hypothetical protein
VEFVSEDFVVVAETKRFLGREFLTWLVHRIEEDGGRLARPEGAVELHLGDRLTLEGPGKGDRLTLTGPGDHRAELGAGLRRGKLLDRAHLVIRCGERRWELVLDGGMFTVGGLRCPPLGERDGGDPRAAFENDLILRLADVEEALGVLDLLFAEFCRLRVSRTWHEDTLPALRAWVSALAPNA